MDLEVNRLLAPVSLVELKRMEELLHSTIANRTMSNGHGHQCAHEHSHAKPSGEPPHISEPENTEASEHDVYNRAQSTIERKRRELMRKKARESGVDYMVDVVIVGAGAAGVGTACTLTQVFGLDPSRVLLLERGEAVGETFRRWPHEMRFISPSFNQQGWTNSFDLNSVAYGTSPAYTLHSQHPSGAQFADYLKGVAATARLSVRLRTEVSRIDIVDGGFDVHVRAQDVPGPYDVPPWGETLRARYVVWAAGEYQYPRESGGAMAGTELCVHNSRVHSWATLPGDDFVIIGGYESGVDAAVNLAKAGKKATVLASTASWNVQTPDPSTELAPYTAERLRQVTAAGFSPRPKLLAPLRVQRVEQAEGGGYNVIAQWKAAERFDPSAWKLREPLVSDAEDQLLSTNAAKPDGCELVVHTPQPPERCCAPGLKVASCPLPAISSTSRRTTPTQRQRAALRAHRC
jgi:putative flavoprotein involved in K+ transport